MLENTVPADKSLAARPAVSTARLRAAMGHFATGVSVVTARDHDDCPYGTTANAISSLSLEPPLVLVCLRQQSETLAAARATGRWAINVLRSDQRAIAERFAAKSTADTWTGVSHRLAEGVPVLDGALATIQCHTHQIVDSGDHVILIGQATDVTHPESHQQPLVFFRGNYADLVPRAARRSQALDSNLVTLPSALGHLRMLPLTDRGVQASAAALVGDPAGRNGAVVVLHRGCLLGDALRSERCGGRARLERVVWHLQDRARPGVVIYHRRPGLGVCARCLGQQGSSDRASSDELEAAWSVARLLEITDPVLVVGDAAEEAFADGRI